MRKKLVSEFCEPERQAFEPLKTENQREGFLIVRAFAGSAEYKGNKDFPISQASLADRLSITPPGATCVIRRLCELDVIAPTESYVIHKASARFRWLLPRTQPKAQLSVVVEAFGGHCQQIEHTFLTANN